MPGTRSVNFFFACWLIIQDLTKPTEPVVGAGPGQIPCEIFQMAFYKPLIMKVMKTPKHTYRFYLIALLSSLLFTGCEKEDSPSSSNVIEGLFYYYTDEANKKIMVIDIGASTPFRRSYTLSDDVTLEDIAQERDHLVLKVYRPSAISTLATKKGNLIKSKVIEGDWLFVANNPFLGLTGTSSDNYSEANQFPNEATGFKLHKMEVINGEAVFAIESVGYPGRYMTHTGHPIQGANLLYLDAFSEPEKAPRFRLYNPKSTFLEGDPSVPHDAYIAW